MIGLVACIHQEIDVNLRYLVIQDKKAPKFSADDPFYEEHLEKQLTCNVYKNGQWGSYCFIKLEEDINSTVPVEHAYVDCLSKGDLDSLQWIKSPINFEKMEKTKETVKCSVYYAALNSK